MKDRDHLPYRKEFIHRPRLDSLISGAVCHSLITVAAAPGYGKTQAVAAYANTATERVMWVDLSDADNDATRFWSHFLRAAKPEIPALHEIFIERAFPSSPEAFEAAAEAMRDIFLAGRRVVCVLDNFDLLKEGESRRYAGRLVEAKLENFCLIVVSSSKSDIDIDKLKNRTGSFRLTPDDLRCTEEEAAEIFRLRGETPSRAEIRGCLERTEGWPLALQLISPQRTPDEPGRNTTDSRMSYIAELFEMRYFSPYDKETQDALIRLAILPRFSLEIAKNLGMSSIPGLLDMLQYHIFIVHDYATQIFRFHELYREFLAYKKFTLPEEEIREIYMAAGKWFQSKEMTAEAIDCFHHCLDLDRMIDALVAMPKKHSAPALSRQILNYLSAFPEDYRARNYTVDYCMGYHYLNIMEVQKALPIFESLKERFSAQLAAAGDEADTQALKTTLGCVCFTLSHINILMNEDTFPDNLKLAGELLPHGSPVHSKEIMMSGNDTVFFLPSNRPGEAERITRMISESAPYANRCGHGSGYGYEHLFAAEAAFYRTDMESAAEAAYRAIYKAQIKDQHDIACNARVVLFQIALFCGDLRETNRHLADIVDYIDNRRLPLLLEMKECVQSWFYTKMCDFDKVADWVTTNDEHRYRALSIRSGRSQILSAYCMLRQNRVQEALASLEQMAPLFAEKGFWQKKLLANIIKSECHFRLNNKDLAIDFFHDAYEMAWANDIATPFIVVGNIMRSIVEAALKSDRHTFDHDWLHGIHQKASAYAKRLATMIGDYNRENRISVPDTGCRLSKRETEVLNHLAKGMTREEIGDFLGISLSGVKKHINGIYNKLGAMNRVEALRIAREKKFID